MKQLDKLLDKKIAQSSTVIELRAELAKKDEQLAKAALELVTLARYVAALAQSQEQLAQAVGQVWHVQQAIASKLSEGGLNTRMPAITGKKSSEPQKPN